MKPLKKNAFLFYFLFGSLLTCAAGPGEYNILDFGAKPDGVASNTQAIQEAIDFCHSKAGGKVVVPAGTFLTETIRLKDNVHLYLETGAVLLANPSIERSPSIVVLAEGVKNVAVTGSGIIDGQGNKMWIRKPDMGAVPAKKFGWKQVNQYKHANPRLSNMIRFVNCENARVEGVMLRNGERGNLHVIECNWVHIENVIIKSYLNGPCEGLRISSSSNVRVSGCVISTADDALVLKSSSLEKPTRNITVTNCIISSLSSAFKIGTETYSAFENIVFSNSILTRTTPDDPYVQEGLDTIDPEHWGDALAAHTGISLLSVDGARVRGITISNIVMDGIRGPIFLRLGNRGYVEGELVPEPVPGSLKDIVISNVVAYGAAHASSVTGIPGHYVENVTLSDITIHTKGGGTREMAANLPAEAEKVYPSSIMWGQPHLSGFWARHVKGLDISNFKIFVDAPDARPLISFDDIQGLHIDHLASDENCKGTSVMTLTNVRSASFEDLRLPLVAEKWFSFSGKDNSQVSIESDQKDIGNRVSLDPEVKPGNVLIRSAY